MKKKNKLNVWMVGVTAVSMAGLCSAALVTDGMVMHVDAENVGVWSLNGRVAHMFDSSPEGNDNRLRAQSTNGGPEIQNNVLNGYDTLLINGTDWGLRIDEPTYSTADMNVTSAGVTAFGVFKVPYATGVMVMGNGNDTSSDEAGWSVFTDATRIHSRWGDGANSEGTTRTGVSEWVVYATVINPTTGEMISVYNGATMSQWYDDGLIGTSAVTEDFRVGNSSASAGMELAELIIYDRVLSDSEWNEVGATLGDKYAIDTTYVIPEPATFGLLGLSAAFVLAIRRIVRF